MTFYSPKTTGRCRSKMERTPVYRFNVLLMTALSTYNVKPVSSHATLEASFSPDGTYIISGSGDGSVYAWNVRSGKVACWASTDMEPPLIKWAPGSLMFATGSSELSFWVPDLSKLGSFVGAK